MKPSAESKSLSYKSFPEHNENHGSINDKKTHPDLLKERANKDFDQEELTRILYGTNFDKHKRY